MVASDTLSPSPPPSTSDSSSSRRHHKKPYKSWLKDGVNGGPCSMQVVVQWLSANYATKWRDDSDNRMPKKLLLQEILDQMQQVGIHHRLAKDVASKISTLQSNYRIAREWYDVIGSQWRKAGAQETDVKKEVLRRFPYWDELHGAFGATTTTITTTTTTTTATNAKGQDVSSTSTMTTIHKNDGPMSIRSIIHSIDNEPSLQVWVSTYPDISRQQHQQAAATAAVAAATAKATATTATATTASFITLPENRQAVIVSTATTTDDVALLGKRPHEDVYDELLAEEKEKTRRVRARADLVKQLVKSGLSKDEIATELRRSTSTA
ncbi:hypothetical protein BDB00DRAFT_872592 [Zychaea mexicana]|uniref:uncharacterized protein n=1 Tax=Zychaea mexicana TaxID=64656 RepID=UPI0022FF35CC|nr:uncharacterized protein BDB00DRAFT_872592 [Zychaea mexicana]KAI9493292.1 hypothetical protein BDB00DRAFT_872592 [Zychaea mexicana]